MTDKRQKIKINVNIMNLFLTIVIGKIYSSLFSKKHLSFAAAHLEKKSKLYINTLQQETKSQPVLHLEPHDYEIDYVNIDLCHRYGSFGAKYM